MMKHRIYWLFIAILLMSGCAVPLAEEQTVEEESQVKMIEAEESEVVSAEEEEGLEEDLLMELFAEPLDLDSFSQALTARSLEHLIEFRVPSIVGALEGQGYLIEETAVDLYFFEAESDYLIKAADEKTLRNADGEQVPAAVNGEYVLLLNGHDQSETILEIFNSFEQSTE